MKFEIDMLAVGNADAIIIRYFDLDDDEYVVLIDAGETEEHGKQIEKHIKEYTTKKSIDLAISTHPDSDHIGGFFYLLSTDLKIDEFWIHDPSKHKIRSNLSATIKIDEIEKALLNEVLNDKNNIEKSLSYVYESIHYSKSLLRLIDDKKISRIEPFRGGTHPKIPIYVLGPAPAYYEKKLDRYRDVALLYQEQQHLLLEKSLKDEQLSMKDLLLSDRDFIDQRNDRSNENNSSVILGFQPKDEIYLFTADAGPEALNEVIKHYNLSNIYFMQIPHHGSRYNITSKLLDYFNPKTAYISCEHNKHYPCSQLVNILKENGCKVFATGLNGSLRHNKGLGQRENYSVSTGI